MLDFPQRNGRFDLSLVDLRGLSPEHWFELKKQIASRARSDRNLALRAAICSAFRWLRGIALRSSTLRRWRAAWISHVRRRREQIAAAEPRGFSDQWLADMGLRRGQIGNSVRWRARSSGKY